MEEKGKVFLSPFHLLNRLILGSIDPIAHEADGGAEDEPAVHHVPQRRISDHFLEVRVESRGTVAPGDRNALRARDEEQTHSGCCIIIHQVQQVHPALKAKKNLASLSIKVHARWILSFTRETRERPTTKESMETAKMKSSLCARNCRGHSSIKAVMKPSSVQNYRSEIIDAI